MIAIFSMSKFWVRPIFNTSSYLIAQINRYDTVYIWNFRLEPSKRLDSAIFKIAGLPFSTISMTISLCSPALGAVCSSRSLALLTIVTREWDFFAPIFPIYFPKEIPKCAQHFSHQAQFHVCKNGSLSGKNKQNSSHKKDKIYWKMVRASDFLYLTLYLFLKPFTNRFSIYFV